jgi:FKBP-type peptidyl-prolyl cis-trans isomerase FklB
MSKMKIQWMFVFCLGLPAIAAMAQQPAPDQQGGDGPNISLRQRVAVEKAALAEQNNQTSASYLATNRTRTGVTVLPSGLQYRVLKAGSGKRPAESSTVLCNYKGELADGSSIDRSEDGKPTSWRVAALLPGLKEAVMLMPIGSRWEIVIPPELAYGSSESRGVGANAVLVYEVELVGIL